ncbi:hypothetical protein FACS1894166_13310 [Bacilli bacterium]|nr:hypothetical protein FACS1894166_13310 [Bacilli bacterium]
MYGGSANENNAASIMAIKGVDGVLVGGASLDPQKFYTIAKATPEYHRIEALGTR